MVGGVAEVLVTGVTTGGTCAAAVWSLTRKKCIHFMLSLDKTIITL